MKKMGLEYRMVGKITREDAVNDVRNGMSYRQAAKLHGAKDVTVERWCRAYGVKSLNASRRKTDDEILDAVMLHKAITCRGLSESLGCSNSAMNKHLQTMIMSGKIQSFRVPSLSTAARTRGLFTKFINTRIYYVSKDDLAGWVRNQLPDEVPKSLRRFVSQTFRSRDVKIFV